MGDSLEAVVKANSIEDVVYRDACRPESRLSIHLVYRIAIYSHLRKNGYRPITLDNRWSRPDRRSNRIVPISVSGFLAHIALSHGYSICGCGHIISLLNPFTTLNLISFDLLCRKVIVFLANFL